MDILFLLGTFVRAKIGSSTSPSQITGQTSPRMNANNTPTSSQLPTSPRSLNSPLSPRLPTSPRSLTSPISPRLSRPSVNLPMLCLLYYHSVLDDTDVQPPTPTATSSNTLLRSYSRSSFSNSYLHLMACRALRHALLHIYSNTPRKDTDTPQTNLPPVQQSTNSNTQATHDQPNSKQTITQTIIRHLPVIQKRIAGIILGLLENGGGSSSCEDRLMVKQNIKLYNTILKTAIGSSV